MQGLDQFSVGQVANADLMFKPRKINVITTKDRDRTMQAAQTQLGLDPGKFGLSFNNQPFTFNHNLNDDDMFSLGGLSDLALRYGANQRDWFLADSAGSASDIFESIPQYQVKPGQFLQRLGSSKGRVLLKRPENYSDAFAKLIKNLHQQVLDLLPVGINDPVVRLESAVFISSAKTITPAHFDPEIGFFCQIRGEKFYHVYDPSVVSETNLERFYKLNDVRTCQVDLHEFDSAKEHVFHLKGGDGFHQPQNAPHWVETGDEQSVSYTFVFETERSRARGRARAFNYYQRRLGLEPRVPGANPKLDLLKSKAMKGCFPIKSAIGRTLNATNLRNPVPSQGAQANTRT